MTPTPSGRGENLGKNRLFLGIALVRKIYGYIKHKTVVLLLVSLKLDCILERGIDIRKTSERKRLDKKSGSALFGTQLEIKNELITRGGV